MEAEIVAAWAVKVVVWMGEDGREEVAEREKVNWQEELVVWDLIEAFLKSNWLHQGRVDG